MNTPHKHAELIKAWADGNEIQYKDPHSDNWYTCTPTWSVKTEYRIKPEKKWYRVAEFVYDGAQWLDVAEDPLQEQRYMENHPHFHRWVTSHIFYE